MKARTSFAACIAVFSAMLLWALPAAQASETIYWSNYSTDSLAFANLDGGGGGGFDTAGQAVKGSEGLAIDSATGRLYWSNFSSGPGDTGAIRYAGLGGGDGGQLNVGAATVNEPSGVAIDPMTRTIYWANYDGGVEGKKGTISYAKLDGSAAGDLNTSGANLEDPEAIAVDPAGGRVYWSNNGATDTISFAKLDNSGGGGNLDVSGATPPNGIYGLAVNAAAGQIYWISNNNGKISHANLTGGGGGDFDYGTAPFDNPYGLAFDPSSGKIYWGNYSNGKTPAEAFGFLSIGGGGGGIKVASAPVDGPQNPVILKGPSGTGAPTITRAPKTVNLACSQGSWAADYAGSFVYQAPRSFGYQWLLNGASIVGANASTITATKPGTYTCAVTGSNQNGSVTQTSAGVELDAGALTLKIRKHNVKAKAGRPAAFGLIAANSGDFPVSGARLCVKEAKQAKEDVKAPKCRSLGKIAAGKKRSLKLRLKADDSAEGTYKVTFLVRGKGGAKPIRAKLLVKPEAVKSRHGKQKR
jgi:hypothetical protein